MSKPQALLDPQAKEFYCHTLGVLQQAKLRYLLGGAYAFARYTGIERHTKDLDIFVKPEDFERVLSALERSGFGTEVTFPHWLGKAYHGDYFVDTIFSSGNGVALVDDAWFEHATSDRVFGLRVKLCPPEEIIWSKAFVQERERFDGADVAHLLRACGRRLDWQRLLRRFGPNWRVLLAHLVLFGFVYPSEHDTIPDWVLHELSRRLALETSGPLPSQRVCRGTLLSRQQYLIDLQAWGYQDARALPDNPMSDRDIAEWTAGIALDGSSR